MLRVFPLVLPVLHHPALEYLLEEESKLLLDCLEKKLELQYLLEKAEYLLEEVVFLLEEELEYLLEESEHRV